MRVLCFLVLACVASSCRERIPRVAPVAMDLAIGLRDGWWVCGKQDWSVSGYVEAVGGTPCHADAGVVVAPGMRAVVRSRSGELGVVGNDWRVGYVSSTGTPVWTYRITDCTDDGVTYSCAKSP